MRQSEQGFQTGDAGGASLFFPTVSTPFFGSFNVVNVFEIFERVQTLEVEYKEPYR